MNIVDHSECGKLIWIVEARSVETHRGSSKFPPSALKQPMGWQARDLGCYGLNQLIDLGDHTWEGLG